MATQHQYGKMKNAIHWAILTMALLMLPLGAMAQDPPGLAMGQLTDYLFVFFDGTTEARWDSEANSQRDIRGGYAGDIVVNGDANFDGCRNIAYEGTIFSSKEREPKWELAVDKDLEGSGVEVNKDALLTMLMDDFRDAWGEICGLHVTSGYENFNMDRYAYLSRVNNYAVHPTLNWENGIAEMIVIDIDNDDMRINDYIYIAGDADDLIIFRWGVERNQYGQCSYRNRVEMVGSRGSGIIPTGGLTPDRMIHAAGDIGMISSDSDSSGSSDSDSSDSSDSDDRRERKLERNLERKLQSKQPTDYLPPFPTKADGTQVVGSGEWGTSNFYVGYWLTEGDYRRQTSDLRDAVFIGGWYTPTTKFDLQKGGMHVPDKYKVDEADLFDVSVICHRNEENPCYAQDDFRGIALLSLTQALTLSVYESNGPGFLDGMSNHTGGNGRARKLLRGSADAANTNVPNKCLYCSPTMCVIYGCRGRNLVEEVGAQPSPAGRRNLLNQAVKNGGLELRPRRRLPGKPDMMDWDEVEYPVVREHHTLPSLLEHFDYPVTPEQGACVAETFCTLTFTMYPQV